MPFAIRSHRPVLLLPAALAGALLLLWAGAVALHVASLPASAAIDAEELVRRAPAEPAVGALGHCAYCGWIESKREVLPDTYEYVARMNDGTTRVFREPLPTTWRLGERMLV